MIKITSNLLIVYLYADKLGPCVTPRVELCSLNIIIVNGADNYTLMSMSSSDLNSGSRSVSYLPSTRSRLQGLKQLSVEKLTILRQRLAETRSKGTSAMAVNIHFRRGR